MKNELIKMKNENLKLKVQVSQQYEQPEINLDAIVPSDQLKPCAKVNIKSTQNLSLANLVDGFRMLVFL